MKPPMRNVLPLTTGPDAAAKVLTQAVVPLLLDQAGAIAYLGVSRSAWYRLRAADKKLPRPVSLPGAGTGPLWRRADLEKYTASLRVAQ
jgi:predicted DNA-binding transcriptional regulator AlpA